MVWFEASVLARREVAGTVHLELEIPDPVKVSFERPGQYLLVQVGALHGPFAPASAPAEPGPLELLFKPGTPLTDALHALRGGAKLKVSLASGIGFPLAEAKGKTLLLVASGTGQAPMRSVIESVRRHRAEYGAVTLLLGVRDSEHLAFADEHHGWEQDGIEVHVTLSRGEAAWQGRKGRVQLHLPAGELSKTVAFLVGQREMVAEVATELQRRGLPRKQIFLNV